MTPLRPIEMVAPGGFEGYFEALALLMLEDAPPDMDAVVALEERYDLEFSMKSLSALLETHGLS
ncbi:MAG: hypothetical protein M3511_14870 [Deinococcota bacterium]|jgi:hypothetical protein|nr:hypothetical protein [Deinococcota bacterium]